MKNEARPLRFLTRTSTALLRGCLVLGMACAHAQTEIVSPSSSSESKTAPGLSYTPAQMLTRLVQLAEGPLPTREELEKEFGFEFKPPSGKWSSIYSGQASYPFAAISEAHRDNFNYYDFSDEPSVVMTFDGYGDVIKTTKYCIRTDLFIKKINPQWQRHTVLHGHFPTQVFYTATLQGISRRLDISPN